MTSGQQEVVKWVALGTMLVDHVGAVLLSGDAQVLARMVGRLAFPLFAFLLAYNITVRGVPVARYVGPLAVFSLVSLGPHWAAFGVGSLNIFPTLLVGVLLIEAGRYGLAWFVGTLAVVLVAGPVLGYGAVGAVLVFLIHGALVVGGWAWLPVVLAVGLVNAWPVAVVGLLAAGVVLLLERLPVVLARSPAWVFWWFYPAHLLLLVGLRRALA